MSQIITNTNAKLALILLGISVVWSISVTAFLFFIVQEKNIAAYLVFIEIGVGIVLFAGLALGRSISSS